MDLNWLGMNALEEMSPVHEDTSMDLLWKSTYWSLEHPNRDCRRVNEIPWFVCIFGKRILVACDPCDPRGIRTRAIIKSHRSKFG